MIFKQCQFQQQSKERGDSAHLSFSPLASPQKAPDITVRARCDLELVQICNDLFAEFDFLDE